MKCRFISALIAIVGLTVCFASTSAQADNYEIVVKYSGRVVKLPGAPAHDAFQGMVMPGGPGGRVLTLLVPNKAPAAGKPEVYDPEAAMAALLKSLPAGALLDITCGPPTGRGPVGIQTMKEYTPKPDEDNPHAFVYVEEFDHKDKDQVTTAVTFSKYLQKSIVKIPAHKDANQDMVSDPVIKGIVDHLTQGELVYVDILGTGNNQTIKLIAPWKNHATGTFNKLDTEAQIDPDGTKGPAVTLTTDDGKQITALVPGSMQGKNWRADPNIFGPLHALKPDMNVDFLTANSGDGRTWLISIAKAKPAPKTAGISRNNG